MSETNKQKVFKKLEDLKFIVEMPKLYLANYFQELRNNVDKEMFSKQMIHKDDNEIKNKLSETWKELISKIDSFEKKCYIKVELQSSLDEIDEIRIMLDNQNESTDLEIIEDKIQEEEINLFRKLFQNKTIIYDNFSDTEKRLLIIDDEYVNWIPIDKRKEGADNSYFLDSNLIKKKEINNKIDFTDDKNISEISLNMIYLQELSLIHNEFKDIKEYTFIGLNNLEVLNLRANKLKEIKENTFSGLNNLRELDLSYNQLTEIKENAFSDLNNLQTLDLSDNKLKEIKENTFIGLDNLKELYLNNNQLTELKENTFSCLNNLKNLYLYSNQLIEIKENTFISLNNLELLHLDSNQLKNIKENTFIGLDNLKNLYLAMNQLTEIKGNTFVNLNKLQALNIGSNQLKEIEENAFIGLDSLQELNLWNNKLSETKENAFFGLKNLQELKIEDEFKFIIR